MRKVFLLIIILCIIAVSSLGMTFSRFSYSSIIKSISKDLSLDYPLVKSICKVESGFKKDSISKKGAIGIMQLMPSTAEEVCNKNNIGYAQDRLFDPHFNIYVGCLYLKELTAKYTLEWAICAYNAGPTRVDNWIASNFTIEDIPYKETREYLKRVLKYKKIYGLCN